MKKLLLLVLTTLLSATASAQERPLWMRFCAISPDGSTIAFAYKGDLYTVPSTGGTAKQLTTNPAYEASPVWSPDGSKIAFVSDREGALNVYVIPSTGGEPRMLTTSSHNKSVIAFKDNDNVIFSMADMPTKQSIIAPVSKFPQVYEVSVKGGRPHLFSALTIV